MRNSIAKTRKSRRTRSLLVVSLAALASGGCVSSRRSSPALGSESGRAERVAANRPQAGTDPFQDILPTAYEDGFISEAPAIVSADEASEELAAGERTADVSDALYSELPRPSQGTPQSADHFVSMALANHPKILAARQRVAAAANRIPQELALPDPMFSNTFWPIHDAATQTAAGRLGNQMSLSQQVPWPEKLRAKAAIANREVQVAQAEVDRAEREIAEAVQLAYYELWYATRALAIIDDSKQLVEQLVEVAEARYRTGGTQQDVLRAQLEADRLDDEQLKLRQQKQVAQADLAALVQQPSSLNPEASEEIGVDNAPDQLDQLISLAEQCNPELRGLQWQVARERQRERLACLQQYPDLQVGLGWGLISEHDAISPVTNGHDQWSFTVGTTLPIWRDKINAGIREASHRTASTTLQLNAQRDVLYGKLRRLLAQADSLVGQRDLYKGRIIPRSEDTLQLAMADYRGKRVDFFTLIASYRELLMFEIQLARINASLAGTVAQIEREVGCPTEL